MSYDLHFFKKKPGKSPAEIFDSIDPDDLPTTDPSELIDVRLVADKLLASTPGLVESNADYEELAESLSTSLEEVEQKYSSIELETKEGEDCPLQVFIDKQMVTLSLPYWEFPPATIEVIKGYWNQLIPVLNGCELVGYDPQLGEEATQATFDKIMGAVDEFGEKSREQILGKRPWWKIW